jgi:hypothetical protein
LLKRKNIAKRLRLGRRPQGQSKPSLQPLFCKLPARPGRKIVREAMVDIDMEIKQRYEEIRVLERLKRRRGREEI